VCIDGIIDNEAGFHSDLPDVFESEMIVKADFVCCTGRARHLRTISGICYIYIFNCNVLNVYIDGVIDYEAGFHSDLPDVFD